MRFSFPVGLALTVLAAACAHLSPDSPGLIEGREPDGAPAAFDPIRDDLRVAGSDTLAGAGCLNPLVDARDGVRLTLVRSWTGHGDYEAPPGRYGLRNGELLRLACNTGRVLGVVRR